MSDEDEAVKFQIDELTTLIAAGRRPFTLWERDFLENISDQWDRRGPLSPRQRETLKKIHEEKTS